MEDLFDTLLFGNPTEDERAVLRERFEEEPTLAEAWAHWRAARRRVRERLRDQLSDRRLLVLYVLEQEGDAEVLTPSEQEALAEARDDIARAIDVIPALERVVERIREERADFNELWETHADDLVEAEAASGGGAQDGRAPQRNERAPRPPQSQQGTSVQRWARRLAGAATIVALAVMAIFFWPQEPEETMNTVTVADGTVRTVALEDGSTVRLVGPATLHHPAQPSQTTRRVTLDRGQAFFDVQQTTASFVVNTPTATATVLGTQFGVTTAADTTEVVLAEGSVRVGAAASSGESVVLQPGQKSWVATGEAPASPSSVDLTTALEWTGLFVFRSVSMETVAQRLSQRYDVPISVSKGLASEPVTGTFEREQPVQQVLRALAATLGASVQQDDDGHYQLVPTS